MNRRLCLSLGLAAVLVAGCVVAPVAVPSNYDRAFSAASGALRDQGLGVTVEDPGRGVVMGERGNARVTATLVRQADGSVRVQFDAQAPGDPSLVARVSNSYDRRMGR